MTRPWAILAAAILALGGGESRAQTPQDPIVFGEQEERDWFTLNWWNAYFEGIYRYQNDERKLPDGQGETVTESRFEETFTLDTNSAIYHPNLVEINASGTFGLTQTDVKVDPGDNDKQVGTIYEWDVNAIILRKEEAPVTLYTRRSVDTIDRTLGPTLDNTITTHGGIVDWRHKTVPTRVEAFHTDQTQSGIDEAGSEFNLSQNTLLWHSEYRPSEWQRYALDYSLNQIEESTTDQPTNDYIIHTMDLSHSVDFGEKHQHNLLSSLSFYQQTGDFDLQRFRWNEDLRLRHTKNFQTQYLYTLDQQDFQGQSQLQNRASAGFFHQLYKSLGTRAEVGVEDVSRSDEGGDSIEYFGDLHFDYIKNVPLGRLTSFLGLAINWQDNQASSGFDVINQARTFNDPQPIVLTGNSIDADSIVVTDSSGFIILTPGVDYTVTEFPDRVEIDRIVGGRIEDGASVLLDYETLPQGANTSNTWSFSIGSRYDIEEGPLKGLSPYFRFTDQNQTIETDSTTTFIPNSFTDVVAGVEYRIGKFTLGYERQWYDSTVQPYNATRYRARYSDRWWHNTTAFISLEYDQLEYPEEDNEVNFLVATARVHHRFSRSLHGSVGVLYRNEQDKDRGDSVGWEEEMELYWEKRQLRIFAVVRNVHVDSDFEERNFQLLRIGIRREF